MKFNYLTHPKFLRQDFGLPNFVVGDIIDKKEVLTIITAFKNLGLNILYISTNKHCCKTNDFVTIRVDKFIKLLENCKTNYAKILIDGINTKLEEINLIKMSEDNLSWHYDNFKICPTLTKLYFRNTLD